MIEGCSLQFLFGCSAAKMILALIADRIRVGFNGDTDDVLATIADQFDGRHNAENVADLVRQFFHQPGWLVDADGLTVVIAADLKHAAGGVGES